MYFIFYIIQPYSLYEKKNQSGLDSDELITRKNNYHENKYGLKQINR